ncbi:hypothetical protein [Acinetobacter phage Ab69]|nr:hypothetical protein [Acinetobacter phage Ab69]
MTVLRNPDRFGYAVVPLRLVDNEPRKDIELLWRIRRSNARSMGKRTLCNTRLQVWLISKT